MAQATRTPRAPLIVLLWLAPTTRPRIRPSQVATARPSRKRIPSHAQARRPTWWSTRRPPGVPAIHTPTRFCGTWPSLAAQTSTARRVSAPPKTRSTKPYRTRSQRPPTTFRIQQQPPLLARRHRTQVPKFCPTAPTSTTPASATHRGKAPCVRLIPPHRPN